MSTQSTDEAFRHHKRAAMSTQREVLQQALKAFESTNLDAHVAASDALRAALAEHTPSGDAEDAARLDWIAIHGSFGVDSASGLIGGNGQRRVAATRKNIDAARKEGKP